MAFNKDNSGSLAKNERKEKDSQPDLKGKATIGGKEFWISGWRKTNDSGVWYSLSFEPKDQTETKMAPRSNDRHSTAQDW